jgi:serine/threonine-protein kinase
MREFQDGEIIPGTRYRVVGLIGSGGMGSVFDVEHLELGKRFVLKALHRTLAERKDLVARLRNEWRALGKLEHPCIVAVTDAGTSTNGVAYFVMERLEGETLSARLRREGRLPAVEALRISIQMLEGLSAAHAIGVVHRDVKPPNIFLTKDGTLKLLDFGIAKMADPVAAPITARGVAIGTPRYMSPEQARGDKVDGRADLYAVGLLLFEMIAGRSPFEQVVDSADLLLAHLTLAPPRLASLALGVPLALDDIVAALLSKDPRERPATARAAISSLQGLLERLRSATEDSGRPARRASNPVLIPGQVRFRSPLSSDGDATAPQTLHQTPLARTVRFEPEAPPTEEAPLASSAVSPVFSASTESQVAVDAAPTFQPAYTTTIVSPEAPQGSAEPSTATTSTNVPLTTERLMLTPAPDGTANGSLTRGHTETHTALPVPPAIQAPPRQQARKTPRARPYLLVALSLAVTATGVVLAWTLTSSSLSPVGSLERDLPAAEHGSLPAASAVGTIAATAPDAPATAEPASPPPRAEPPAGSGAGAERASTLPAPGSASAASLPAARSLRTATPKRPPESSSDSPRPAPPEPVPAPAPKTAPGEPTLAGLPGSGL